MFRREEEQDRMASLAQNLDAVKQADIIAHATVALDGREDAIEWLQTPHSTLNDRTPLEVVCTGSLEDLQFVDRLLTALEFGIYV